VKISERMSEFTYDRTTEVRVMRAWIAYDRPLRGCWARWIDKKQYLWVKTNVSRPKNAIIQARIRDEGQI